MQRGLIENGKQEAAGRLLLDSIAIDEEIDVSKDMISNLVKQKKEVHNKIKKTSAKSEITEVVIRYFKDEVVTDLNPHLTDDICTEMTKLLNEDTSVSDKKRKELIALYQEGLIGEFLAKCFLYAVNRPNKQIGTPEVEKQIDGSYGFKDVLKRVPLEKEIKEVIIALDTVRNVGELEALSLNALRIDQKILPENVLLLNKLKTNVLHYFYFVRNSLSQTDNFECIALDIRKAFLKLEKTGHLQDEIIDHLTMWIWEQTGRKSKIACEIIVAFFVQNCEVFNEIAK